MKKIMIASLLFSSVANAHVSIDVCGESLTFDKVPTRAVANDINMLKIMLALDLKANMAGYSGVSAHHKMSDEIAIKVGDLPEIAPQYPSQENLLNADADFYFAGWNYGMQVGGIMTPVTLAQVGIKTYAIKESCAHVQQRSQVTLEDTFYDIASIAKIFKVESKAKGLIEDYQARLAEVKSMVTGVTEKRVFVYDSGQDKPFTAGALAVPNAIIEAAGGANIMRDVAKSWTRVNWEAVVDNNPEHIIIIDYGQPTAIEKIAFLKRFPATQHLDAVLNDSFTILTYAAATPGIENIDSVEKLARDLYPNKFN
ncbi:ABC transporter substrate-binding protein [Psychromonas sp. Urea-02u-13]|uniref:ABC transporter substrate-binding protein n=1 Tax=Psychromonas sp. Urea-02u-13 TaxID=2058326 RepID=UPI000C348625|nr:ABC transporter substrate-binding protein [Psychromonas sp. Urea-02u-13]PKG37837.1 iron ABC transporter substrate-binding protein [Psychromonas sp. Urea-02u-13]